MAVLSALFASFIVCTWSKTCNPMDYGAKGDGKNDDTKAIQSAMDDCFKDYGVVSFPEGKHFVSFPLKIEYVCKDQSGCGIELQKDSQLIISNDRDKWPDKENFLTFKDVESFEIFGTGEINGQGEVWWENRDDFRPLTMMFDECSHVTIKDIEVKNCPNHCLEMYCNHCEVDGISIINPPSEHTSTPSHNTDGIDIHGSITGDDNVAIHSSNVLIENCVFGTGHGASIGSISSGYLSNITINECQFNGTDNGPKIKVQAGSGPGKISNVHYTNLQLRHVGTCLEIDEFYDGDSEPSQLEVEDIYFEHISGSDCGHAGSFKCQESTPCKNIYLNDVKFSSSGGYECEHASGSDEDTSPKSCL